jgi:hypothetical protein
MLIRSNVWPALPAEYELWKTEGKPVTFVVNSTRRSGYYFNGWYVYESCGLCYKTQSIQEILNLSV